MTSGEPDFTKRMKGKVDHWWIKGVELVDPYVAAAIPISVENDALAYDPATDRFKVAIEDATGVTFSVDLENDWTRQVGQIDLARVLGSALAHANPVISRLTNGTAFIDPRDRNWTITETVPVSATNLDIRDLAKTQDELYAVLRTDAGAAYDARDISDNAARLLGKVYGNQDVLQQRAATKELLVQIQHQGAEKDPTQIRALTNSDVVTVEQATAASLKATVTQAAKDREISDITKVGTWVYGEATSSGNTLLVNISAGQKVRIKFVSLWNNGTASITVGIRFTTTGTLMFKHKLTEETGHKQNLIGSNKEGGDGEDLYINLSAAGTVAYDVGYEVI